jgi:hypothetical protein
METSSSHRNMGRVLGHGLVLSIGTLQLSIRSPLLAKPLLSGRSSAYLLLRSVSASPLSKYVLKHNFYFKPEIPIAIALPRSPTDRTVLATRQQGAMPYHYRRASKAGRSGTISAIAARRRSAHKFGRPSHPRATARELPRWHRAASRPGGPCQPRHSS